MHLFFFFFYIYPNANCYYSFTIIYLLGLSQMRLCHCTKTRIVKQELKWWFCIRLFSKMTKYTNKSNHFGYCHHDLDPPSPHPASGSQTSPGVELMTGQWKFNSEEETVLPKTISFVIFYVNYLQHDGWNVFSSLLFWLVRKHGSVHRATWNGHSCQDSSS